MEQNRIIRLSTKVFTIVFAVLYTAITVVGSIGYSIWNGLLIATALILPTASRHGSSYPLSFSSAQKSGAMTICPR